MLTSDKSSARTFVKNHVDSSYILLVLTSFLNKPDQTFTGQLAFHKTFSVCDLSFEDFTD